MSGSIQEMSLPELNVVASEVLRVLVVDDGSLRIVSHPSFSDPSTWGHLLVDVARSVSDAYEAAQLGQAHHVFGKICDGLLEELAEAADLDDTDETQ